MICNIEDKILKKIDQSYPDLNFHLRNSTNLVKLSGSKYLGLGHAVLDYKGNTDINKFLMKKLFLTILFTLALSGCANSAEFLKEGELISSKQVTNDFLKNKILYISTIQKAKKKILISPII